VLPVTQLSKRNLYVVRQSQHSDFKNPTLGRRPIFLFIKQQVLTPPPELVRRDRKLLQQREIVSAQLFPQIALGVEPDRPVL